MVNVNINKTILDEKNLAKLLELKNQHVLEIVERYVNLCRPSKVTVLANPQEDAGYIREFALKNGE